MKYALAAVFFTFCFALSVAITCGTFGLAWLVIGAIANIAGWVLEPQTHVILAAVEGR
jgi:hypothetical protein